LKVSFSHQMTYVFTGLGRCSWAGT